MSKALALLLLPPDDAAKTLLLASTDTDALPLRRCNGERLACWKGILKADEAAALRTSTSGRA
jgi:hypothetical protein